MKCDKNVTCLLFKIDIVIQHAYCTCNFSCKLSYLVELQVSLSFSQLPFFNRLSIFSLPQMKVLWVLLVVELLFTRAWKCWSMKYTGIWKPLPVPMLNVVLTKERRTHTQGSKLELFLVVFIWQFWTLIGHAHVWSIFLVGRCYHYTFYLFPSQIVLCTCRKSSASTTPTPATLLWSHGLQPQAS